LDIYLKVLTIWVDPTSQAFMRASGVLQERLLTVLGMHHRQTSVLQTILLLSIIELKAQPTNAMMQIAVIVIDATQIYLSHHRY
jgi:hypothetical protein